VRLSRDALAESRRLCRAGGCLPASAHTLLGRGADRVAGVAGGGQLLAGIATPPDADLPPHLSTWALPAVWLLASVALPSAVASWLAWHRSRHAPAAAMVASAGLAVELAVQVPFIGFSGLQLVFGSAAATIALVALDAWRRGWPAR
jgi:hypothetical protein